MSSFRVVPGILLLALPFLAQAQIVQSSQAAFAIVTPESGNLAALIPVETLSMRTDAGRVEAEVAPAALLTTVAFPVELGTVMVGSTAVAIVNPTAAAGNVHLSVTNPQGIEILSQTLSVLPRGQLSRFLNEIFAAQINPDSSQTGLLTITSDAPVAVLALNFSDAGFASLPVASLASPLPLPVTTTSTGALTTTTSTTGTAPIAFPTVSVMPSFGSFATAIPSPVTAQTTAATTTIGGAGAFIFPQVANFGEWSTRIRIANTSSAPQTVRIDLFDPNGVLVSSMSGITIPSRGLYNFS